MPFVMLRRNPFASCLSHSRARAFAECLVFFSGIICRIDVEILPFLLQLMYARCDEIPSLSLFFPPLSLSLFLHSFSARGCASARRFLLQASAEARRLDTHRSRKEMVLDFESRRILPLSAVLSRHCNFDFDSAAA